MNVLITGSSGEIGTNLGLKLLDRGDRVFGVDKRMNTWTDRIPTLLQDLSQRFHNFVGGIGAASYPKPDVVVHLAANAKVHELVEDPQRALDNIILTFNVLEYCRANNVPIIFGSSREVYGDINRFDTSRTEIKEPAADFVFTESTYSASKVSGESLIYSYAQCYDIPYIVFRFSNVYGRYDNDIERMERVIPLFINKIGKDEQITIFGAEKTLDFTFVDDTVQGLVKGIDALTSKRVVNKTMNLACGSGYTLVQMANFIAENLGKTINPIIEPTRPGEITYYIADISEARELLGFEPTTTLPEGIKKAIAWQREFAGVTEEVKDKELA
ncbi:MAG: nucleoside-diphosphate sugar epimerase [Parcubacteria group bacterium]|nr:nucleoside-diphosphate sugar epimerase [Parcubacteria group bacterium]